MSIGTISTACWTYALSIALQTATSSIENGWRVRFVPLLDSERHGAVWAAESTGGTLIGYAVVTWGWSIESGGADALLDEIHVTERDQGVGAAMLEAITADCRRRGCSRLFLETERANVAARRFYCRHGFHVEDSIWMSLILER